MTKSCRAAVALLLAAAPAFAQQQDLSQAAADPTAPLMNFQFQISHSPEFYGLDDARQTNLQFRAAIPFTLGDRQHIFRVTAPIWLHSPSGATGLSDMTIFDLVTFDRAWGRFGVGAVALLPTGGRTRGAEKWGLGPAFGFTARSGGWLWGLFNQNIFTVAGPEDREDVNVSILQPILNHGLGQGWSIGNSEMTATYDWEAKNWSSLPLGVKLSKLGHVAGQPVQASLQYEHDFADDRVTARDTFSLVIKVLMPKS